jgi:hypothetical protein
MGTTQDKSTSLPPRIGLIGFAWLVATGLCGFFEYQRIELIAHSEAGLLGALFDWNADTTLSFAVLLLLPVLLGLTRLAGGPRPSRTTRYVISNADPTPHSSHVIVTILLCLLSFSCSLSIGLRPVDVAQPSGRSITARFCDLPSAYHDEFSYLLQAKTFLAGRLSWPAATVHPELFHQIHVLNEPTTASRYFPWTGAWMAPFVAIDQSFLGHWIAGALACAFFHRSLLRLLEPRWAFIGGLLIATSPGLSVFSNLLLAHHPTLLALSIFLWAFLRLMESRSVGISFVAGTALTLAMLGRPMTAAGFALPFGSWLFWKTIRPEAVPASGGCQSPDDTAAGSSGDSRSPLALTQTARSIRICIAMGLPLIAGFIVLAVMNHHITGSWTKSAYQLYTDTWTPRHRFGFNNVVIGEKLAGSKVLDAYNRWATNLTPDVAATNLRNRVVAESQWSLGVVSLLFLMIIAVPMSLRMKSVRSSSTSGNSAVQFDCRLTLIMLSIVSLYLVHVPYWYDGILHWHYVFESAPLILIFATLGLRTAYESLKPLLSARWATAWLTMLVLSGLLPNWLTAETLWGTSRVSAAVSEQSFSRVRFEQFRMLTSMPSIQKPCLILVDESSSDPQLSFIVNSPDLTGDVITCRKPQNERMIQDLRNAFPDRTLYEFQPQTFEFKRVP